MARKLHISNRLMKLEWPLVLLISGLTIFGFVVLYSAAEGSLEPWSIRQIIRFAFLLPFMLLFAIVDIKVWFRLSYLFYGIALVLVILTEIMGVTAMGATRWLKIGFINIQTSEVMKLCMVFALARYFHTTSLANVRTTTYLLPPFFMLAVPVLLILQQPDMGTALILLMVGATMFFATGVQIWKFLLVGAGGIAAIPFVWKHMHDYQKERITSFLDPEHDPLGNGYNILQSKIAIGSGGFTGKGFLKGTQSQLSFLPEKQTDFIFTMFTEEFGFVGGIIIIAVYAMIIAYGVFIAVSSRNHFGRMMAIGIISVFFFHVFVNIAMVMGLMPIVGVPLPLLSYGGTIMTTVFLGFAMLLNVNLYKDEKIEKTNGIFLR
jgi:rod shape determining protein RodA